MASSHAFSAAQYQALRQIHRRFLDPGLFLEPIDFRTVLATLTPAAWPPREDHAIDLAHLCSTLIGALHRYEIQTLGSPVMDLRDGPISTAQARRLLAQDVSIGEDGHTAVTLVEDERAPRSDDRTSLFIELRAFPVTPGTPASRPAFKSPEFLVGWEHAGQEYDVTMPVHRRESQWYMLEQLRDDLLEGRLS